MLEQRWEHTFTSPISDVVLFGERVFAALKDGLVVLERGAVAQMFDGPVRSLVTSDDEQTLLAVSAPIDAPPHYPMRRWIPAEEKRLTRRIYRISSPWTVLEDLGVVPADGWCATFDGRYWPTFEGDDVHVFECTAVGIALRARLETFWPYHMERIPQGVRLEISSLGASHFQNLSLPDLHEIDSGDIRRCKIDFPPECFSHIASGPSLGPPLFAVVAAGIPRSSQHGEVVHHPIRNVDRIMTLDGRVVATLPAPATGLAISGERALYGFATPSGMAFLLIRRETAQVTSEFVIDGATSAGARIFGRDIAVWERRTLRVFQDVGDA